MPDTKYSVMTQNVLIIIILSICSISCLEQAQKEEEPSPEIDLVTSLEIPDTIVDKSVLFFDKSISRWNLNEDLFSGHVVHYNKEGVLIERFSILNGKKQNQSIQYFADGHYQYLSNYHEGRLHGEKKSWSSDSTHILLSHLNYVDGKAHGEQKKWYPTGELFKKVNLNMGREEGLQQGFRKNGDLFANYEAINGRTFGLKKTALCFGLEDQKIPDEK